VVDRGEEVDNAHRLPHVKDGEVVAVVREPVMIEVVPGTGESERLGLCLVVAAGRELETGSLGAVRGSSRTPRRR
jgi:hypothetical protein